MTTTKLAVQVVAENFVSKPIKSMIGFVTLYLPQVGITIKDCPVFENERNRWVSFPSKSYKDAKTGEQKNYNFIYFPKNEDGSTSQNSFAFQDAAMAAINPLVKAAKNGGPETPAPASAKPQDPATKTDEGGDELDEIP